ncbi:Zn finger protein HupH (egulating hydrogenase expression) [Frankia canadensis]|uniref:Hydrogenase maturation factor HypA n=1 Tax=Frankia canadensis TaxID=1836972 RepID=A0A2I2KNL7_9ACTN|nr:hydrogenase maturation nickel metallochaperone HypA [Frankia canadensis]SNQ47264.1 Zn finger protein HupH (egulating hydrogenase expression) [Frankia canadensis]SOU54554.1 Zn finger protein HupH (egulating hydrogenase expression) [Frankia canadensis]
MHELSLCRSVADIVRRHAAGRRVIRVRLRVGALRQVVPDTLAYCWRLMQDDSVDPLAGSVLEVQSVPAVVRCRACGTHSELDRPVLRCAGCGGADVELVSGEEFLVVSFEVATEPVEA